ncbi:MAG: hypothetical protein LBJ10_10780, partial [Clostridiales bacterium]|nr:hypothetical protein [Clostridiales bacterium]
MRLNNFRRELDAYTVRNQLGDVLWPFCDMLSCENLDELIDELKARGLYVFDIWGFVPGSWSPSEPWGEYEIRPDVAKLLIQGLGDHFLGFDNGEQDGRYVNRYADMACPAVLDRKAQYLNFLHHFEKISDSMQHHITALVSLHYGHYLLKENDVIILGSECAQALPNVNLWFAFNRGAGKQYGALWFGNASVWNRWGYKNYSKSGGEEYEMGPQYGASASLLRRIIYLHYAYNCDILGYDCGWLYDGAADAADHTGHADAAGIDCPNADAGAKANANSDSNCNPNADANPGSSPNAAGLRVERSGGGLTPVGVLQSDALAFVREHGYPGAMHTPVAVALGFFAGYTPPRHLYSTSVYKAWGNQPYDEGDYQTHALFNLLYPGYEDAGFFRDERGFMAATPFGDMFDVLLSDAEAPVLKSYNRIVLSGGYGLGPEEFDKIRDFAEGGGTVHVFLGAVAGSVHRHGRDTKSFLDFFGLRRLGERRAYAEGSLLDYGGKTRREKAFALYDIELDERARAVAFAADGRPAIYEAACGQGKVCVVAAPFGLHSVPAYDRS